MLTANKRVLFAEFPNGFPEPGKTLQIARDAIELENIHLEGGVLIKTLYLCNGFFSCTLYQNAEPNIPHESAVDPYMRGRMRAPEVESYRSAFTLGHSINGHGIGRVLRSEHTKIRRGDHVYGTIR
jgi:N-terminal domain of oxidoreductase